MRSPKNSLFFVILLFCFFSCLDAIIEKQESNSPHKPNSYKEQELREKSRLKPGVEHPEVIPKENKKPKTKTTDTLRPLMAVRRFE
jgi:hypothetical protein